ncbi:hypothetical protein HGRIS_001487 [Hohenbuehelia grisea]|uniref:Uncharacterized protein n=1 Tax=Hohenbuehelia grisea TaxID=104357 RepID=A0ABR3JQT1_9AGAR
MFRPQNRSMLSSTSQMTTTILQAPKSSALRTSTRTVLLLPLIKPFLLASATPTHPPHTPTPPVLNAST